MKTEDIFNGKKEIIVEFFIGILFVFGIYYLFTVVKDSSAPVTTSIKSSGGVGSDFGSILQDLNKTTISLDDKSLRESLKYLKWNDSYQDFSVTILPSNARGRDNPFILYATPRPSN